MPRRSTLDDRDRALLQGKNFAHVASFRADGSVHVVPVWVDVDDGQVVLNGARSRGWLRNLERDGRVTINVQNLEDPYEHVEIEGRAVVGEPGDGAEEHIDTMARKYLGMDVYPDHREDDPRIFVRVEPDVVRHHGGG